MNNVQRLEMETKGVQLEQNELIIYLQENTQPQVRRCNRQAVLNTLRLK